MKVTARDRQEFEDFCRQATDAQLRGIYEKEKAAGRHLYAKLAENEAYRRGVEVK
jgi:hypothetical protein